MILILFIETHANVLNEVFFIQIQNTNNVLFIVHKFSSSCFMIVAYNLAMRTHVNLFLYFTVQWDSHVLMIRATWQTIRGGKMTLSTNPFVGFHSEAWQLYRTHVSSQWTQIWDIIQTPFYSRINWRLGLCDDNLMFFWTIGIVNHVEVLLNWLVLIP